MILFLGLFVVLFLIVSLKIADNLTESTIASLLISLFLSFAISKVVIEYDMVRDIKIDETRVATIASLTTNNQVTGSFVLGCGTINNEEKYVMMRKVGNNSYQRYKLSTKDVTIIEDDNIIPGVVQVVTNYNSWVVWSKQVVKYKIYVPKGTIVKQFQIK